MTAGDREIATGNTKEYQQAWQRTREIFGDEIYFFAPSLKKFSTSEFQQSCNCYFVPISVTGDACSLRCDHCRAGILKHMAEARTPEKLLQMAEELKDNGARGILVSGGSDSDGVVPLEDFTAALCEVTQRLGLRVIVHTGITGKRLAARLAEAKIDAAMIDIIGSSETIRDVYHLRSAGVADFERSLYNLTEAGVRTAPHIVFGLHYGQVKGEKYALDIISGYEVTAVVLLGLLSLAGTPMADFEPPSPEEMGELFLYARERLPHTTLLLGCERPAGEHKIQTDALALRAGINGIAYPAEGTIKLAKEMGLRPRRSELCCALASDTNDDEMEAGDADGGK